MNINKQFGMRVKYLRKKRGFSQEDLALQSDTNKNYICDIECGRRNPTLKVIEKISIALQIEISELFKGLKSFDEF